MRKSPRPIDSGIMGIFSKRYNDLKEEGFYPGQIRLAIQKEFKINDNRYYRILQKCRQENYITDKYEDNKKYAGLTLKWRNSLPKDSNDNDLDQSCNSKPEEDIKTKREKIANDTHNEGTKTTIQDITPEKILEDVTISIKPHGEETKKEEVKLGFIARIKKFFFKN